MKTAKEMFEKHDFFFQDGLVDTAYKFNKMIGEFAVTKWLIFREISGDAENHVELKGWGIHENGDTMELSSIVEAWM